MTALLLLALSLPNTAFAETRLDKWQVGQVGSSTISGVVEVKLYGGIHGEELPLIRVKYGPEDKGTHLYLLDFGSNEIILSEKALEKAGASKKVKNKSHWKSLFRSEEKEVFKTGGKFEVAVVPRIDIAEGLTLHDVRVKVGAVDQDPLNMDALNVNAIAGIIGVGALPFATAALPSQGVVRFAPATDAAALLAQVGTPVPFTSVDSDIVKTGFGKEYHPPVFAVVDATISGQALKVGLSTASYGNFVAPSWKPGSEPSFPSADFLAYYVDGQVAGQPFGVPTWAVHTGFTLMPIPGFEGVIGQSVLRRFDIAVDPVNKQLALSPAKAQVRNPSLPGLIERKTEELKELDEKPAEEKEKQDEQAAKEERAKLLDARAKQYLVAWDSTRAIADLQEATTLDPTPCGRWLLMAKAQAAGGFFADAEKSATKGLDLYDAWVGLPKAERARIEKMSEEELKEVAVKSQDLDGCAEAAGVLAGTYYLQGRYADVAKLYDTHKDLDPLLHQVAGSALLRAGKVAEAGGPLRQAQMRAVTVGGQTGLAVKAASRFGLMKISLDAGDSEAALAIWKAEEPLLAGSQLALELYTNVIRAGQGDAQVVPALEALTRRLPDYAAVWAALAAESKARGLPGAADQAAKARALFDNELAFHGSNPGLLGAVAYFLATQADDAGARAMAAKALAIDPHEAYSHLALAFVEGRASNEEGCRKAHETALKFGGIELALTHAAMPPVTPKPEPPPAPAPEPPPVEEKGKKKGARK